MKKYAKISDVQIAAHKTANLDQEELLKTNGGKSVPDLSVVTPLYGCIPMYGVPVWPIIRRLLNAE